MLSAPCSAAQATTAGRDRKDFLVIVGLIRIRKRPELLARSSARRLIPCSILANAPPEPRTAEKIANYVLTAVDEKGNKTMTPAELDAFLDKVQPLQG